MIRRCATCWNGTGDSESNWLCDRCVSLPANRDWVFTPSEEIYGLDQDDENDCNAVPDSPAGPFETPLCIEIMRRFVMRQSRRRIARDAGTSLSYVNRTISYWKSNYGYFLTELLREIGEIN